MGWTVARPAVSHRLSRGPAARPRSPHPFAKELLQDAWHRGLGSNRRRAKQNASVYLTEVE